MSVVGYHTLTLLTFALLSLPLLNICFLFGRGVQYAPAQLCMLPYYGSSKRQAISHCRVSITCILLFLAHLIPVNLS